MKYFQMVKRNVAVQPFLDEIAAEAEAWDLSTGRQEKIDVQREPAKAARFNVTGTPVTVLIERDTENWFPVAVGSESFPAVADNAYRAVRFLRGEITETQFFNGAGDDGGFFDPEAARND